MNNCKVDGIDFKIQDQLKDVFSGKKNVNKSTETNLMEILPLVVKLKTILKGKVYLKQTNLKTCLFHSISFFPITENQRSKLSSFPNVGNKIKLIE